MVREDLETVIDRLLDFVRTNKSCTLQQASKALALNPNQVERLALLLEESDLLEVQYTLTGIKLAHREQEEKKQEELKEKAREKANAILTQTQELEKQISTSEHMVSFMQKDVAKRLDSARGILSSLKKKREYSQAELAFAKREVAAVKVELKAFKAGLKELKAKQDLFEVELEKFEVKLARARVVGPKKPGLLSRLISSLPFHRKEREKPSVEPDKMVGKPAVPKRKKPGFWRGLNPFNKKKAKKGNEISKAPKPRRAGAVKKRGKRK